MSSPPADNPATPPHVQTELDSLLGSSTRTNLNIRRRLYISHFLSTWNTRVFEFGAVLFLASIFPETLLPSSVYALSRALAAIVLSPAVGRYIDNGDRLQVVRFSIVAQRAAVVLSCVVFWFLLSGRSIAPNLRALVLGVLVILACVEKLCSVMNLVAVERDWVVVISQTKEHELQVLNSQMRRIDLFCKLAGPFMISVVDGVSTTVAILATLGMNVMSVVTEYYAIAKVYELVPALQASRQARSPTDTELTPQIHQHSQRPLRRLVSSFKSIFEALSVYFHHPVFLPSIALSLLYFTVLNFAGQMVTYLLSVGYSPTHIVLARTMSVIVEVSSTWLTPIVMTRLGTVRSGLWFINWQIFCVAIATQFFWSASLPFVSASGLVGGVIASRLGLWGFDLCVQILVQEEVEPEYRGSFSSLEASFHHLFELCSYASTIYFYRPAQFHYPVLMSSVAVFIAGALYAKFARDRRGHLLHMPSCLKGMGGVQPRPSEQLG